MAMDPTMTDPNAASDDGTGEGDESQDFTVCITISGADGSITVGEDKDDEGAAQSPDGTTDLSQAPPGDDSGMEPAQSIKQALQMAGQMLAAAQQSMGGGNTSVMAKPGGAGEQDAAAAAFKSNRG